MGGGVCVGLGGRGFKTSNAGVLALFKTIRSNPNGERGVGPGEIESAVIRVARVFSELRIRDGIHSMGSRV